MAAKTMAEATANEKRGSLEAVQNSLNTARRAGFQGPLKCPPRPPCRPATSRCLRARPAAPPLDFGHTGWLCSRGLFS
eukprot:10611518-Alexandrium_andersonii.AAC.1